jgi:hypothetical protein
MRRPILFLAAFAVLAGPVAGTATAGDTKTVIELFTSQGCSSCPPADKLLGELAKDSRLVALTLAVDYWDYLGWRDTLALHAHTVRQKSYAEARGDRQVFTPQAVINGVTHAIGSDRREIAKAIAAAEVNRVPSIPVSLRRDGDNIIIEIGAGSGSPAPIHLLGVACETRVGIGRGENRGKTVTYANAVRIWRRLGEWRGAALHKTISVSDLAGLNGVAVLLQPGSVEEPGPIRGAAFLRLE